MSDTVDPHGNAAIAERLGVGVYDFTVVSTDMVTPSMRRIVLTSESLDRFTYEPGQDLMFTFAAGGEVVRRRYTIRSFDAAAKTLELQIVAHGNGPGATWAESCRPGDLITGIGPRGKVVVDREADWHLFAGDATFIPAAFSMLESLPKGTQAIVLMEVGSAQDQHPLVSAAELEGPHWVDPDSTAQLLDLLDTVVLPGTRGHAYLGGESQLVRAAKDLLVERGLDPDDINAKAYWRADAANASHGEPGR